jgi:ABC-type transporter Mla subunit MlaD
MQQPVPDAAAWDGAQRQHVASELMALADRLPGAAQVTERGAVTSAHPQRRRTTREEASAHRASPAVVDELIGLSRAVSGGAESEAWARVQLHQVFDIGELARQLHPVKRSGIIAGLDLARTAFILLPVALTWFGISEAVRAYGRYLTASEGAGAPPGMAQPSSFIALWQTGFGGELSAWAQLGSLALTSSLLIILVIALTIAAHWAASAAESEADRQRASERDAIRGLLSRASRVLAHDAATRAKSGAAALLATHAEWLKHVRQEREETVRVITDERAAVLDELRKHRNDLYGSIVEVLERMEMMIGRFRDIGDRHVTSIERHVQVLHDSAETFERLLSELAGFGHDLRAGADVMLLAAEEVKTLFGTVHTAISDLSGQMETVVDTLPMLIAAADRAAQGADSLVSGQASATAAVNDAIAAMRDHQEILRTSVERATVLAQSLAGIQSGAVDVIKDHSERLSASAEKLDGLLIPFATKSDSLVAALDSATGAAKDTVASSGALSERLKQATDGQTIAIREVQQLAARAEILAVRLLASERETSAAREALEALTNRLADERQRLTDSNREVVQQARDALTAQGEALKAQAERAGQLAAHLASVQGGAGQAVRDHASQLAASAARLEALTTSLDARFAALGEEIKKLGQVEEEGVRQSREVGAEMKSLSAAVGRNSDQLARSIQNMAILASRMTAAPVPTNGIHLGESGSSPSQTAPSQE